MRLSPTSLPYRQLAISMSMVSQSTLSSPFHGPIRFANKDIEQTSNSPPSSPSTDQCQSTAPFPHQRPPPPSLPSSTLREPQNGSPQMSSTPSIQPSPHWTAATATPPNNPSMIACSPNPRPTPVKHKAHSTSTTSSRNTVPSTNRPRLSHSTRNCRPHKIRNHESDSRKNLPRRRWPRTQRGLKQRNSRRH